MAGERGLRSANPFVNGPSPERGKDEDAPRPAVPLCLNRFHAASTAGAGSYLSGFAAAMADCRDASSLKSSAVSRCKTFPSNSCRKTVPTRSIHRFEPAADRAGDRLGREPCDRRPRREMRSTRSRLNRILTAQLRAARVGPDQL